MKLLAIALAAAALTFAGCASNHHVSSDGHMPGWGTALSKPTDAAWLAKAVAAYPLTACVVSGDKLGGSMGEAIDLVYRQAGQPDRLVRFCCSDCSETFAKSPAKYLKMLDDAAAAKAKP